MTSTTRSVAASENTQTCPPAPTFAITPFGTSGPYRDYRTHHLNVYHSSPHTTFSYAPGAEPERAPPRAGRYLAEWSD